ncbi:hypothetical protein [Acetanaerobacterium elongatum]|uniref:Uncharacterized protein n=1 Tax=Acetanaerobacterium elongatum TaxID=258515 RepID=A0A1H0CPW9_9FIRM|nr:hypothetical protein [Acetanaerobacterium elongatum]SDN59898.1 hypothetical protein SAMN05192585_12426 [Acetanaerobacterium elongatum]
MLRGTNKRVIEVINTENDFFERIIFIVNNEKRNAAEPELKRQANSYMTLHGPKIRRAAIFRSTILAGVLKIMAAAAAGAAISSLCFMLLMK